MLFNHLSSPCLNTHQNKYKFETFFVNNTPDPTRVINKQVKMQNVYTDGNIRYRTKSFSDMTPQDELLSLIREVENREKEKKETTETLEIPTIKIVEEPELTYRARYESEGCKGPIHGSTENCFPSIKVVGYVGEVVITVYVVTRDNEPHLHTATGPGSSKFECKEVRLSNGVQAIQMAMKPTERNEEMLAIFDQLSIRRIRNWEADKELRDRGIEPVTWKTKKKEAKLAFHVSIPPSKNHSGYELTAYSRSFQCTAPSGNPEIYWSSHAEGSPVGGQEMGFHGKKFASGFKIRFFSKDDDGKTWEAYADIDRNKSSLHSCVFKVPPYFQTHLASDIEVFIEIRIGSEKEPRISEPVQFTYLAESETKCKNCDQYKNFIAAIHQLFSGRHDLNGIVGSIQSVLNKNTDSNKTDIQVLESNSLKKFESFSGTHQNTDNKEFSLVGCSKELSSVYCNSHFNFPINTEKSGEIQILSCSDSIETKEFPLTFNNTKPKPIVGFCSFSNTSFTHLHPKEQLLDLSSNNASMLSTMSSQTCSNSLANTFNKGSSYLSSHNTVLPSVEHESFLIKTDQTSNLGYLNYSQINNNECISFPDSEHVNVTQKDKDLIDNSVFTNFKIDSEDSLNIFNGLNSKIELPVFTYTPVDLHRSPLQASCCSKHINSIGKDLTGQTSNVFKDVMLNLDFLEKQRHLCCTNLDHQDIQISAVCNNREHPEKTDKIDSLHSLNDLSKNCITFENNQCKKNVIVDSYISLQSYQNKQHAQKCLHSISEPEFICNFQVYSQGDENARVNQLFCPVSNTQIQESPQNPVIQNEKVNASFMQHNFPASTNWINRQLDSVSADYNFYVNNTPNPTISFAPGNRSMEGLNCTSKSVVISSPPKLTYSFSPSDMLNSLNKNDRPIPCAAFQHNPHIYSSENINRNLQINLLNDIQMSDIEGLKALSQNGW